MVTVTQTREAAERAGNDGIRVAVSTVIFSLRRGTDATQLVLPLVRRTRDPFAGRWALPGGWLGTDENLDVAAARTLGETTSLAPSYLEQLYAFGDVERSPQRVVSIVYWALVREEVASTAHRERVDDENVAWFPMADLPPLAFDHAEILDYALWRLRNKVGYSRIAHGLLPDEFTLADLREVYEVILDRPLDPANFRRQVEKSGSLLPTGQSRSGNHRPAALYRRNPDIALSDRGPLRPSPAPRTRK